jgi:hypothetical protein
MTDILSTCSAYASAAAAPQSQNADTELCTPYIGWAYTTEEEIAAYGPVGYAKNNDPSPTPINNN